MDSYYYCCPVLADLSTRQYTPLTYGEWSMEDMGTCFRNGQTARMKKPCIEITLNAIRGLIQIRSVLCATSTTVVNFLEIGPRAQGCEESVQLEFGVLQTLSPCRTWDA